MKLQKNLGTYVLDPEIVLLESWDVVYYGLLYRNLGQFAALVELNGRK